MKLFFLAFLFPIFTLFSKETVLIGNLIGSGQYLETEDGTTYSIEHSDLARELLEISGKKIRILCDLIETSCNPIRYEISPFATETNLPKWTMKQIPRYVFRGLTAFNPTVTPDGNVLFWSVQTESIGHGTQKIWYSELDEYGFWKRGIQMSPPLNNRSPSAVIAAMPGGNELFVFGNFGDDDTYIEIKKRFDTKKMELLRSSKSPREFEEKYSQLKEEFRKEFEKIQNKVPLYKSFKQINGWSMPTPIKFPDFYNLYKSEENPNMQVFGGSTLSSSGQVLIYSAKHKDSLGKLDLYISIMKEDGTFPLGTNLGNVINTEQEETAPFLASDDRTLYFASTGHSGLAIYVTQRIGDGWTNWTKPQETSKNLKGVNFFSIPASGNWAYLSKQGSLYMTFLPKEQRPNPVILVKGKVTDNKGKPLSAEIIYESLITKEKKGTVISDPNTGSFSLVLPYGDNYGFYAQAEGHIPAHNNADLRGMENLTYKEVHVNLSLAKLDEGEEYILQNVFFDSNSAVLKKESEPELDRLGDILNKNPNLSVLIEGHTDNIGKSEDNLILSLNRANSVAYYLITKHNIPAFRIRTAGLGEEFPIAPNDTPENRAKNRRVVFKIIKKVK